MTQHAYSPQPVPPGRPAGASGLAITALVIAIIALLLAFIPVIGLIAIPVGLITLVLGIIAWVSANKNPSQTKGIPITATIISAAAVSVAVLVSVLLAAAVGSAGGGLMNVANKTQAMIPIQQSGTQAVADARAAGVDPQGVRQAEQAFQGTMGDLIMKAEDPEDLKVKGQAALDKLDADLAALPKTAEAEVEPTPQP